MGMGTRSAVFLILVLFIGACSFGSEERTVRRDFHKEHPDYSIVSVGLPDGHGGSSVVTMFIRYRKPNDGREYWSDWAYETKDGKFELVEKGSEQILSAVP
jgi:hypothetical protein